MNLIAMTFSGLGIFMFIFGQLINYFTYLIPDIVVSLFRYGRANISKNESLRKIEIPKRWFWHFYLWASILQASVVITVLSKYYTVDLNKSWLSQVLISLTGNNRPTTVNATSTSIAVILFQVHLVRRLLETLFVAVYSGTKMNISHYALGFVHYTFAIFALVSYSPGFSSSKSSAKDFTISYDDITKEQIFGVYLILYGNYQQFRAHKAFADLRRGADTVTTLEHKIPMGGLFDSVSCPNYWAEIVIYVGITFLMGLNNYTWNCCTVWVIANQVTAGVMNHNWYLEKFREEYPKDRKAVIPYIW